MTPLQDENYKPEQVRNRSIFFRSDVRSFFLCVLLKNIRLCSVFDKRELCVKERMPRKYGHLDWRTVRHSGDFFVGDEAVAAGRRILDTGCTRGRR